MKELSIEEKAQRYDEALGRAKEIHTEERAQPFDVMLKVFPELKESEDEGICRKLIAFLRQCRAVYGDGFKQFGLDIDDALAWLEKQAEHANFRNKIQIGDKVTRNEDGVLVNLSQLNRVAKKDKKQGEQNLIKHFCDCVHVGCHVNDCKRWCHSYQKEISYTDCNSNCNRYSKLMNHAFNIGETITDGISTFKIADIKDNYYIADDGERVEIYMAHRYYTTIQNLEAQKPAWSDEDEKMFERIIAKATLHFSSINYLDEEEINFLKSLRPQNTWKPSEEQIKAVKEAACYSSVFSEKTIDNLISLSKDLKKLKG